MLLNCFNLFCIKFSKNKRQMKITKQCTRNPGNGVCNDVMSQKKH